MTKNDINFDGWFEVLRINLSSQGIEFTDRCAVLGAYNSGESMFDVADGIAAQHQKPESGVRPVLSVLLICALFGLFGAALLALSSTCDAGWTTGGTLTDGDGMAWQTAPLADKLASSARLISSADQAGTFSRTFSKRLTGRLAASSIELAVCMDGLTKKLPSPRDNLRTYSKRTAGGMATLCYLALGWAG